MVGTATGEFTYNGFTFDGSAHIRVDVEFLYDDAHRTVIAHRHRIMVDAVVNNDTDLDGDLEDLRQRLGESGKNLTFKDKGFGDDLVVKPNSDQADIANGPHPQTLSWHPLGDNNDA